MINFSTKLERAICHVWNNETWKKELDDSIEAAKSAVEWLKKQGITGNAEYYGTKNFSTTAQWQEYGGPKRSTSKTDFIIGNYRISLKVGKSRLMSGGKPDSTAIFSCIQQQMKCPNDRINEILSYIQTFINGVCSDTVAKSRKNNEIIQEGDKLHKKLTGILTDTVNSDKELSVMFVREAITGRSKFGDSPAVPTHLFSVGTSYKLYDVNDNSIMEKIAQSADVRVSFKASHLKGAPRKGYRFWSVIEMALNKIREEYSFHRHDMLSETVASDMWNKIKGYFITLFNNIKSYISDNMKNLLDFLELEPEITYNEEIVI